MDEPVTRQDYERFRAARAGLARDLGYLLGELETRVPLPHRSNDAGGFEYVERSHQQALLLLLVDLLSGIEAEWVLLEAGLVLDAQRTGCRTDALIGTLVAWSRTGESMQSGTPSALDAFWRGDLEVDAERSGDDLSPARIMQLYGGAAPRFHIRAAGSPAWLAQFRACKLRMTAAARAFSAAAMAFGHPGMFAFAADSAAAYAKALQQAPPEDGARPAACG